ncbi:MAG: hypothetical protein RLZZ292_2507 [Bacteroidota bacterium]|jgi:geranylgeranyl reductase family protein
MPYSYTNEVTIIGAGPSGCSAGLFLAKQGIAHLILEKSIFPRDKICGDAISSKSLFVLKKIDPNITDELNRRSDCFHPFYGALAVAPNQVSMAVPMSSAADTPAGYVSRRLDFDHFLVQKLTLPHSTLLQGATVTKLERIETGIEITYTLDNQTFIAFTKCVIAADGDRSVVKKNFAPAKLDPKHYAASLRAYYQGVTGFSEKGEIEVYFPKSLSPGYFWIFPLPNGRANVGLGMLSHFVRKDKINLKTALTQIIEENPTLKTRFANATLEDKLLGWGLPLGSKLGTLSGDRFLLTGDAGGLIDPISGEGIGTGLYSGMLAADAVAKAIEEQNFSASFFHQHYTKRVKRTMGIDFKVTYFLQRLCRYPWLLNFSIGQISKNKALQQLLANSMDGTELKKRIFNPRFYVELLRLWWKG